MLGGGPSNGWQPPEAAGGCRGRSTEQLVAPILKTSMQRLESPCFLRLCSRHGMSYPGSLGDDAEGTVITQVVPPSYLTD